MSVSAAVLCSGGGPLSLTRCPFVANPYLMKESAHKAWVDNYVWVYRRMKCTVPQEFFDRIKMRGLLMHEWTIGPNGDASFEPSM